MTLGERTQNLIKAKGYKTNQAFLKDLSALFEENSITRRTLTRLIHNKGDVRLRTLMQVAHVLGINISTLKEGTDAEIFHEEQSPGIFTYNRKAQLLCLQRATPFIPTKLDLKPGGRTSEEQDRPNAKDSVKWFYVAAGKVDLVTKEKFGEERRTILKGENRVIDGRIVHYLENTTRTPATVLIVHYPAENNIFYTARI